MSSFLSNGDPAAIEGLYEQYCKNPESIDTEWRNFFQGFEFSRTEFEDHDGNSLNPLQMIRRLKIQKRKLPSAI